MVKDTKYFNWYNSTENWHPAASSRCPSSAPRQPLALGHWSPVQLHHDGFQCPHIGARGVSAEVYFVNMLCCFSALVFNSNWHIASCNKIQSGKIRQGKDREDARIRQTLPKKSTKMCQKLSPGT